MKATKFFAIAMASTALLVSCAKEQGRGGESNNAGTTDRSVLIRIDRAGSVAVRSESDPVASGTPLTLNEGYLVFADKDDVITYVVTVLGGTDADESYAVTSAGAAAEIGIDHLDASKLDIEWITGVPGTTTQVTFLGNLDVANNTTIDAPKKHDDLSDLEVTVEQQCAADGGVGKVMLHGWAELEKSQQTVGPGGADINAQKDFDAIFDVTPIVSRFEFDAITGTHSDGTSTFTYQIDGIFIDRYFSTVSLADTLPSARKGWFVETGANKALFATDATYTSSPADPDNYYDTGYYKTANRDVVYNVAADMDVTTPGSKVWAYNLLVPYHGTYWKSPSRKTTDDPRNAAADEVTNGAAVSGVVPELNYMPAIIIKLSNVVVDGETWQGDWFLTIENFYSDPDQNTSPVTKLGRGMVYTFSDIKFNEGDIQRGPYIKNMNVYVRISMIEWETDELGYDFN
jgi:hypothetical protein